MIALFTFLIGGGLLRSAALAAVVSVPAFVGGYVKGRLDADMSADLAAANGRVRKLEQEANARSASDEMAREAAEVAAALEAKNDENSKGIEDVIRKSVRVPDAVPGAFMQRLRGIK